MVQSRDVVHELGRLGVAAAADPGSRAQYASDASLYRIPPLAVAFPRDADQLAAVLAVATAAGVGVTARGAGTSVAGNAVGRGIVADLSRHFGRVVRVDAERHLAVVEPGVVQAQLQSAARPSGLRFGPDPATHSRCTIGGMIGNNACGARSLGYGRTSDNLLGLRLFSANGGTIETGYDDSGKPWVRGGADVLARVRGVLHRHLGPARTEFGRFGRQLSGYAAQHLVPERFDLTLALAGSEGTLGLVTQATVRLVQDPPYRVLVVIGFDGIIAAAEAAVELARFDPVACEGLDARLLDVLRRRRGAVPELPAGAAWLFVELAGDQPGEVRDRARRMAAARLGIASLVVTDPSAQAALWAIREDGAGLAGRSPAGRPAWPGWEDAAVPPAQLAPYLAKFDELVASYGMTSAPFGHFGEGCVHVRLDFPLGADDGRITLRAFLLDAARLVAEFGGSLSGEHGDGRARSELLPLMYSADAIAMFAGIKRAFDPNGLLNPGVLVEPDAVDADLRLTGASTWPRTSLALSYSEDGGDFGRAVHRCTGIGKCRADNAGGVMCPSYLATRDERDSTRGRARVLQDVVRGDLAWTTPEVHAALDLCLACKGCAADCPAGVDLATYKAEVLHQSYRGRLRPRSHYTLGWLPRWARLARRAPRLANRLFRLPLLGRLGRWLAGIDPRRSIPKFAVPIPGTVPFSVQGTVPVVQGTVPLRPVVLWVDTFSDSFQPEVLAAAVRVLESAGYAPQRPEAGLCCALTWITTGQLDAAKRILGRAVAALAPSARAGIPIVGLEPSCTAVLRRDAVDLLGSADARAVAAATSTLAELLSRTPGWRPPDLTGLDVIAQPHCHQHAVLGWTADQNLLTASGATLTRLSGCCGLAGNFGVELGHYEVSVAVAEQHLLPALDAAPGALILADGFSCRTQVADLRGRVAVHLAQLLDRPRVQ